jgi:hypothetical protein
MADAQSFIEFDKSGLFSSLKLFVFGAPDEQKFGSLSEELLLEALLLWRIRALHGLMIDNSVAQLLVRYLKAHNTKSLVTTAIFSLLQQTEVADEVVMAIINHVCLPFLQHVSFY